MGFTLKDGATEWSASRDSDGHRDYNLKFLVSTNDPRDGPVQAMLCPGLPLPGTPFIVDNDADLWAWCRPDMSVEPVLVGEPNTHFKIGQKFSTRPPDSDAYDPSTNPGGPGAEDPLLQPPKISGGFNKGKVEATHNFNGVPILTSSFEQIRGPQVEFDSSTPTVKIEQNVSVLNLPLLSLFIDTVNALPLWGLAPRTVKLSSVSWERKFTGISVYFVRTLEFDINYRTHDRVLLDEGRKCLNGHFDNATGNWILDNIAGAAPVRTNPLHYSQFKDRKGENCRVVLNGAGLPSSVLVGLPQQAASYVVGDSVTYGGNTYIAIVNNINVNPATSFALPAADRKWLKQVGSLGDYQDTLNYVVGNLVTHDGDTFIANTDSPAGTPFGDNWTALPAGVNDRGAWQGTVTPIPTGGAGYVYVTYYPGTNMALLGIPLAF